MARRSRRNVKRNSLPAELDYRRPRRGKVLSVRLHLPRPIALKARREIYTYPFPKPMQNKRFFEEHGYVISVLFVRPVSVYMNRIPRTFLRRDYEQYWQRELEMMGDQIIQNNEIYGDSGTPTATFGYIPRYDDYRHGESVVAGEFRTTLDSWHLARKFASQPALNATFINCDPATRIYASTTTDQLYVMAAHQVAARRLVSKHARN